MRTYSCDAPAGAKAVLAPPPISPSGIPRALRHRPVHQPEIFAPVFIHTGDRNGRRAPATHSRRNQTRLICELSLPVISKEENRRLSRHNKIEPTVVVEVDEFSRQHTVHAHRLQGARRAAVAHEGAVTLVEPER